MSDPQDVEFPSAQEQCAAWLYLPDSASAEHPVPIVVMAHGLGGVRRAGLAAFAERFQAAGYAALVFDYRYFGDSTGEPRELLSIRRQREDWRNAVAFARTLPEVDANRVIVWGTSFSGGHVIATAAADKRIAAAIAQCPFTDGLSSSLAIAPLTSARLTAAALRDVVQAARGKQPVRLPLVGPPGSLALLTAPDAEPGYLALLDLAGYDVPKMVPARVVLDITSARPGGKAKDVECPILFVVCERDSVCPPKATIRHARKASRGEIKSYDVGHFDIYLGEEFETTIPDELDFLRRHVPVS